MAAIQARLPEANSPRKTIGSNYSKGFLLQGQTRKGMAYGMALHRQSDKIQLESGAAAETVFTEHRSNEVCVFAVFASGVEQTLNLGKRQLQLCCDLGQPGPPFL